MALATLAELDAAHKDGHSYKDIAARFGYTSPTSIRGMLSRYRRSVSRVQNGRVCAVKTVASAPAALLAHEHTTDAARAVMRHYLRTTLNLQNTEAVQVGTGRRIAAFGDIHGNPDAAVIAAVIALKPDVIVLGGDLLNSAQYSGHAIQHEQPAAQRISDELRNVRAMIETLLLELPNVSIDVMRGNHDDWVYRYFVKDKAYELARQFFRDPLDLLIADLPRTRHAVTEWQYQYPGGQPAHFGQSRYMHLVGDALLSHANFSGKKPGAASDKLYDWMRDWQGALPALRNVRLLVQFHGHKMAHIEISGGHHVRIEPGMAGLPHVEGYKAQYDARWTPGALGGVTWSQSLIDGHWCTDMESVQLIRPLRKRE